MNIKATSIPGAGFVDSDGESALYYSPNQLGQMNIIQARDAASRDGMVQMVSQNGANANERHTATQTSINNNANEIANTYFLAPEQMEAALNHRGTEFALDATDVITSFPTMNPFISIPAGFAFSARDLYDYEKALAEAECSDEEIQYGMNTPIQEDVTGRIVDTGDVVVPQIYNNIGYSTANPIPLLGALRFGKKADAFLNKWLSEFSK